MVDVTDMPGKDRILRLPELMALTKLSRGTINNKRDPKSPSYDPSFPTPFKLGSRLNAWRYDDVIAWLAGQSQRGGAGHDNAARNAMSNNESEDGVAPTCNAAPTPAVDTLTAAPVVDAHVEENSAPFRQRASVPDVHSDGDLCATSPANPAASDRRSVVQPEQKAIISLTEKRRIAEARRLIREYEQRIAAHIYAVVEKAAQVQQSVLYRKVMEEVGLTVDDADDQLLFDSLLRCLSEESFREGEVLLSVLVHEEIGKFSSEPCPVFFQCLSALGHSTHGRHLLVQEYKQRAFEFFAARRKRVRQT